MSTSSSHRAELLRRRLRGQSAALPDDGIRPAAGEGPAPLSPAQRRLWVLDRMESGSTAYLMGVLLRLRGPLDEDALDRALAEVAARHEVLRSRHVEADGEPVQVVDPPGPVARATADLSGLAADAAEGRLTELVGREGKRPFDLAAEHPLRTLLVRLPAGEHALLLVLHHIAADGWSESVLLSELDRLYGAFAAGLPSPLPPLPLRYADVAAWQRDRLTGDRLAGQLGYWRGRLAGLEPPALPTDRPRGPVRDAAGATAAFEVPAELAARLTALGREHGATPFMVALAAFDLLLSRHCRQYDIAVGTPVAGRDRAETHPLIGLFANTVVLRTDLAGDPAFGALLGRVRETVLGAHEHQDTPFDLLVNEFAPRRDAARTPLVQVAFQFDGEEPAAFAALPAERIPVDWNTAKFDLFLSLAPRPDGSWTGQLEYATALFDPATAARLTDHYLRLLDSAGAAPDRPVSALEMLSDAERELLLDRWAGTAGTEPVGTTVHRAFEQWAARTPGAVAVTSGTERLTYADLEVRANRLAHRLLAAGVTRGELVGVRLERGPGLVVALLAVLKAGAGYLPLDPAQPADRLAYILADAGARVVIGDEPADGAALTLPPDTAPGTWPGTPPPAAAGPDDVAYVIYTSGSTGRPKGVPVTHANVLRLLRSCADDFGFGPDDVWTLFHSYAFDFSVWELWGALLHGGRAVVVPYAVSRSPRDFLALLAAEGVTVLNQTPSAFRTLAEAVAQAGTGPGDLALRTVVFGGEALDVAELAPWYARFGADGPLLVNMYGITETTVHVTHRPLTPADAAGTRPSPIGRPLSDLRVYLLDDDLLPVPPGVAGQIFVAGPGLARGYLGRPALTAERFGPDPYAVRPGERMYRTGDVARFGADGDLEFLGRADDQVKIRGHRIEPGEIEAALVRHPGVEAAVVVAHRAAGESDARLVAYVTAAGGGPHPAAGALRDHLGRTLPPYMVPALFVPMDGLPMTGNGKVDRRALPEPHVPRATADGGYAEPRNPVERIVAECWAEVLGAEQVGAFDNFFDLGGDSIRAIRAVAALAPRGVRISVQDLLVHQTVAAVARLAQSRPADEDPGERPDDQRVAPFALLSAADRELLPEGLADAYPLSMVQAAMVYQMLADRDTSPYHNITLFPFTDDAPLSMPALRAAAGHLARRHEILRTRFDLTRFSEPLQLVGTDAVLEVGYDDLRGRSVDEVAEVLGEFTEETRRHPFDVTRAPMLRFHVHQTADDRWTLSFIECHAILDGWSHHSLLDELLADYRALRAGRPPAGPAGHTVRFADHVALEKRSLAAQEDRAYWRDVLAAYDRAELPAAWAADPAAGEPGHRATVDFADLEPGLRRLAAAAGAPLKSVLFAAHLKVLSIICGTNRFHSGLVGNGRLETEGGDLVRGMHLNTLPVGVDLTGARWTDLVGQVLAAEAAAWPHRRFPLPEMQRAFGAGTPLVDVAFTYLDFHVLDTRPIDGDRVVDVSPNEFGLDVWTFPGVLCLTARPDRIGGAGVERLAGLYRRVLAAMAADPYGDARTTALDEEETRRLLSFAAGPDTAYPELCLHELFERQAARTPAAVALHCADGSTVSYAELDGRANRLARRLRELGAGHESRVGVLLRRGPELVVALLAVLKAGAGYLPLDPAHPARRQTDLVAGTRAGLVVTQRELAGLLDGSPAKLLPVDADDRIAALSDQGLGRIATPTSLAYIVYTSGSTGVPKGVMIEHRSVVNYVCWSLDGYRPLGGTGAPLYSSMAFDLPVTTLFPALLSGQAVTLTPDDGTPGIDALVAALEQGEFGLIKVTPSHLALLNQALSPRALRRAAGRLIAGGEELTREKVARWAEHAPDVVVDNEYGPTETTVGCSWLEGTAATLGEGVLPIGRPFANTTMRVLDRDLRMVPAGVIGELYIGGAQLARGYAQRPALTADRFVPDPYATTPGERLYRTGDLARYRADGVLEFAGRVDHQVKIRGFRIEPGEVEAVLRREAAVRVAAVRVHTTPAGEKELAAYLVPAPGASVDAAALRDAMAAALPAHMVPAHYVVRDELPMTSSGKVDLARLPAPEATAGGRPYRAPRTAVENILARAWAEALGREQVGIDDNFTELGGHSLTVMRIVVKLREEHGYRLSFQDFYRHRTLADLAAAVTGADGDTTGGGAADTVVWLRRSGSRQPLFCVHPGSAHWFAELAAHLDPDLPVAAFEWPGLTRPCPPPESVAQIAEMNLAELRRIVPAGPYRLLGWCGGSQITSEMVRRLRAEGEQVDFLLLDPALDTFERENMHEFVRRCERAEAVLADIDTAAPERLPELQREAVALLKAIIDEGEVEPPLPGDEFWAPRVRVWRELLQTRLDYRHTPHPGDLHLIAGDELAAGEHEVAVGVSFEDYTARWSELTDGTLRVHRVGGNHLGVLRTPHVAEVAALLDTLLADGRPAHPDHPMAPAKDVK